MKRVSPCLQGRESAGVVPPRVARAAGYVTGLAGGSSAVTATKDRLRNGKSPAPTGPVDERCRGRPQRSNNRRPNISSTGTPGAAHRSRRPR